MAMITGIVPARFLTIMAHLIVVVVVFWTRGNNVKQCLDSDYTDAAYEQKDLEIIVGLSLSLVFFLVELIGFLGGISMFAHSVCMISIAAHCSAAVSMSYYVFEEWNCDIFWYIFGFCSALPAFIEVCVIISVLGLKKNV